MTIAGHQPWADKAEMRLRYVQSGCAGLPEPQRRAQIAGEIEHLLKEVPAADRRSALLALLDRFPSGLDSSGSASGRPEDAAASLGLPFLAAEDPPETLAAKLAEAWPRMTADERAAVEQKLAAAGILRREEPSPLGALSQQVSVERGRESDAALSVEILKARLDIDPDLPVDLSRLFRLMGMLVPGMETIEEWVWTVWRQLAPGSRIQRTGYAGRTKLSQRTGAMLSAPDNDPSGYQASLDATQRLQIALLNAIGLGARNFSRDFAAQLSPDSIEREVRQQHRFRPGGLEPLFWELFRQREDALTPNAISHALRAAIARAVEELYHSGPGAWQDA